MPLQSIILGKVQVPIRALVESPRNARSALVNPEVVHTGIEELAVQIDVFGLMYPLAVVEQGKGKKAVYEVDAGERRRRALSLLVEQKKAKPTDLVDVLLIDPEQGLTVTLLENYAREQMHPLDEFFAFRRMIDAGHSVADVAARFALPERTVQRRMQLTKVAPRFLDGFRRGDVNLDQLAGLAVTDDHEAQENAWRTLPEWNRSGRELRRVLTAAEIELTRDPLARFVGLAAYTEAGGRVRQDLFSAEAGAGFLLDAAILESLADARLNEAAQAISAEGWMWVEARPRCDRADLMAFGRFGQQTRQPTDDEKQAFDAAQAEIDRLETALEAFDEGDDYGEGEEGDEGEGGDRLSDEQPAANADEAAGEREALEAQLEAASAHYQGLRDALAYWDEDMMKRGGAIVTVNPQTAAILVHRGLVRMEDRAAAQDAAVAAGVPYPSAPAYVGGGGTGTGHGRAAMQARPPRARPAFPEPVMLRLTSHRTAALQAVVADMPRVALAVLAQALAKNVLQSDGRYGPDSHSRGYFGDSCAHVTVQHKGFDLLRNADDLKDSPAWTALIDKGRGWLQRYEARPKGQDLLTWLLSFDEADLHAFVALAVAFSLDAIETRESSSRLASSADRLAQAVGLDMARWWEPTPAAYLTHVSKAMIAAAVAEARSPSHGKAVEKMKKGDAVAEAAKLLPGTGWLPAPLRARPVVDDALSDEDDGARDDDAQGEGEGQSGDGAPDGERTTETPQAQDHGHQGDGADAANDGTRATADDAQEAPAESLPEGREAFIEEALLLAA